MNRIKPNDRSHRSERDSSATAGDDHGYASSIYQRAKNLIKPNNVSHKSDFADTTDGHSYLYMPSKNSSGYAGNGAEADLDGGIRIFCDGSWSSLSKIGGFAAVAIENDTVLACSVDWREDCESAREVEGLALVEGMKMASLKRWTSVILISDSTEAIWNFQSSGWVPGGPVHEFSVGEELLRRNPGWNCVHVIRECNRLADCWAKRARRERWKWKDFSSVSR
ncbi:hypothetical protein QQ045_015884 [Rhodiola kirilowii]